MGTPKPTSEQSTSTPQKIEASRRNSLFSGEAIPNGLPCLHMACEADGHPAKLITALRRAISTRTLGLRAEVPHSVYTTQSSFASVTSFTPSAAPTVTLSGFEVEVDLSGSQAESSPQNDGSTES